jgi:hypothetical protein
VSAWTKIRTTCVLWSFNNHSVCVSNISATYSKVTWFRSGLWYCSPKWSYYCFTRSLVSAGIVPDIRPRRFPSTSFPVHYSLRILPGDVTKYTSVFLTLSCATDPRQCPNSAAPFPKLSQPTCLLVTTRGNISNFNIYK